MWWALEQEGYMHQKLKELGGHLQAGVQTEESRPVQRMEQTHRVAEKTAGEQGLMAFQPFLSLLYTCS